MRDSGNIWLTVSIVALVAVLIFGAYTNGLLDNYLPQEEEIPAQASTPQFEEDQPIDDKHMQELKAAASDGDPVKMMALVDHQLDSARFHRGYLAQAAAVLERLLGEYPTHAWALRKTGNIYYQIRNAEKAALYYERYLALHPEDANAHVDLGTVYLQLGDPPSAIAQYEHAIELFPDFYNAHFNLAFTYEQLGNEELQQFHTQIAEEIDGRVGRQLAPDLNLPKIPDMPADYEQELAGADSQSAKTLEAFFRDHSIIGPKMRGFQVNGGVAMLLVEDFPMEAMPPVAKETFKKKIMAQLEQLDQPILLEIRDAANGKLHQKYSLED
jgi:tetratricopeptide (TPR) repeat protein